MKITRENDKMLVEMTKEEATILLSDVLIARQAPPQILYKTGLAIVLGQSASESAWQGAKVELAPRCNDERGYAPDELLIPIFEWLRGVPAPQQQDETVLTS